MVAQMLNKLFLHIIFLGSIFILFEGNVFAVRHGKTLEAFNSNDAQVCSKAHGLFPYVGSISTNGARGTGFLWGQDPISSVVITATHVFTGDFPELKEKKEIGIPPYSGIEFSLHPELDLEHNQENWLEFLSKRGSSLIETNKCITKKMLEGVDTAEILKVYAHPTLDLAVAVLEYPLAVPPITLVPSSKETIAKAKSSYSLWCKKNQVTNPLSNKIPILVAGFGKTGPFEKPAENYSRAVDEKKPKKRACFKEATLNLNELSLFTPHEGIKTSLHMNLIQNPQNSFYDIPMGHLNPGDSGGPVVYFDQDNVHCLLGLARSCTIKFGEREKLEYEEIDETISAENKIRLDKLRKIWNEEIEDPSIDFENCIPPEGYFSEQVTPIDWTWVEEITQKAKNERESLLKTREEEKAVLSQIP